MEDLKVGNIIKDRYALVRFLGNGSFGEVWLAHDQLSCRDVALKIYLTLDPAGIEEFQREYANTIDLSGPFLLTPEYFDVYGRRPFLIMKYCENGSSSKLVGNVTEEQLWQFIQDVANGLAVLHNQSDPIVHQDIKPDNILIDENGRFLITDFGISKRLRATMRRQSKRDVSTGAMPYMAPERFDSNPRLNTASDIWSLGASIYELATGELPFSGFGGAMQRNGADIPSLPSVYSVELNSLMQKCLSLSMDERPSVTDLLSYFKDSTDYEHEDNRIIKLNHTITKIQLDIEGNITDAKVFPCFNNAFGWIWFFVILLLCLPMFGFLHDLHRYLYMNGENVSLSQILRGICLICPIVMWTTGYLAVKNWKSIGKYLMSGAIYIVSAFWLWGIWGMLQSIMSGWVVPNKSHWYDFIDPIIGFLYIVLFIVASIYGLFAAIRVIKRGSKNSPAIWLYSGGKFFPFVMEFILPVFVIVLYIISWHI